MEKTIDMLHFQSILIQFEVFMQVFKINNFLIINRLYFFAGNPLLQRKSSSIFLNIFSELQAAKKSKIICLNKFNGSLVYRRFYSNPSPSFFPPFFLSPFSLTSAFFLFLTFNNPFISFLAFPCPTILHPFPPSSFLLIFLLFLPISSPLFFSSLQNYCFNHFSFVVICSTFSSNLLHPFPLILPNSFPFRLLPTLYFSSLVLCYPSLSILILPSFPFLNSSPSNYLSYFSSSFLYQYKNIY